MVCSRPLEILLVEDDSGDVELTKVAMEACQVPVKWYVVENGVEAMAFLQRQGKYGHVPTPDLVLLDLNMPKKDGRQVLAEIKGDESLKSIPVVVLTTSSSEADILRSYRDGANCYVTKPVGLERFIEALKSIEQFWFTVAQLPTRVRNGCDVRNK